MSQHFLMILLALTFAAVPACVYAGCKDDTICVDEIFDGERIELRARNLRDFPITYTLALDAGSRSRASPNTVTRTLDPGESQHIMSLDSGEGGNKSSVRYKVRWTVGRRDARHDDEYLYSLPYAADTAYRVLQGYGAGFSHRGREEYAVDFDMRVGTPVHAARSGIVARIEESNSTGCWDDDCGQYANYIVVLHTDDTTGEYYHLDKDGALVSVGDHVVRGQKIGLSGNTGHTTMPHLHFAVYRAIDWGRTQSIEVRFQSADGIINRPRRGARYQAMRRQ